ncbi:hypothetical protein BDQ17DRAFT_1253561 [Cyathus striatus]|nr:hypothetical protein BDQ17DRAFT_1253561 [Cyathus striatus]
MYELDEFEWELIEELCKVLKDATLFFSRSTPNLTNVIPAMDHINNHLTATAIDSSIPSPIRSAAGLAKKTLNKYYLCTDESEAYRIAMILHPQHKLQYFRNSGWQEDWISTALDVLCS